MAIRYGYPKGREDVEGLAKAILPAIPNHCCEPGDLADCPYDAHDAAGVAHAVLTSGWIASHDAALIEQARAEGKAEADAAWAAKVSEFAADLVYADCPTHLVDRAHDLAAGADNQRQALAALITRHEAHDGRVPCCQLRAVLGMPARDRGEK